MRTCVLAMAVVGIGLWVTGAGAQNQSAGQDESFLMKAVSAGAKEVKVSEHAEKNARNEQVKAFAKDLVKDHTKANKELLEHARGLKVAVATGLEKDNKTKFDNLTKLTGADYDREYIKMMIDDHKEAINLFETEARSGK